MLPEADKLAQVPWTVSRQRRPQYTDVKQPTNPLFSGRTSEGVKGNIEHPYCPLIPLILCLLADGILSTINSVSSHDGRAGLQSSAPRGKVDIERASKVSSNGALNALNSVWIFPCGLETTTNETPSSRQIRLGRHWGCVGWRCRHRQLCWRLVYQRTKAIGKHLLNIVVFAPGSGHAWIRRLAVCASSDGYYFIAALVQASLKQCGNVARINDEKNDPKFARPRVAR